MVSPTAVAGGFALFGFDSGSSRGADPAPGIVVTKCVYGDGWIHCGLWSVDYFCGHACGATKGKGHEHCARVHRLAHGGKHEQNQLFARLRFQMVAVGAASRLADRAGVLLCTTPCGEINYHVVAEQSGAIR